MSEERIVRGGHRRRTRETWTDVFMWESMKAELRGLRSQLTRLRATGLNWANSRGLESEPQHLHAHLRELGKAEDQ